MPPIVRRRALALAAGLAAPALLRTPIARAQATTRLNFQLNWFGSGDHTPIYLAKKRGFFAEEAIDITIQRGTGSSDTARRVELKQVEFGIADAPTVISAVARGSNLVMLGTAFDKAGNNAFFRKSKGITTPRELAGKKVAVAAADAHRVTWPAFARAQGMTPDAISFVTVRPEAKQAIVASGDADVSFDLYTGYPLWERALGATDVGHLLWADFGFDVYGLTYIAHRDTVQAQPELCRKMLRAIYRGWAAAKADPAAAVDALVSEVGAGLDRATLLATMPYVMELCITQRSREDGIGWMRPEVMRSTLEITASGGGLDRTPDLDSLYTNAFNSHIRPA